MPSHQHPHSTTSLDVDTATARVAGRRVFRYRIEVHSLRADESGEREGRSENHVTLALMLGGDRTVRLDMSPDTDTMRGVLHVRQRDSIVSRRTIRMTDLEAVGCPTNFDVSQRPPEVRRHPEIRDAKTVQEILDFINTYRMHRYRFMYVDSCAQGCRYWIRMVIQRLQTDGYLSGRANLAEGLDDMPAFNTLVTCSWDSRDDASARTPSTPIPGLFLLMQNDSRVDSSGILDRLRRASRGAMEELAEALSPREERLPVAMRLWDQLSTEHRGNLLIQIANVANIGDYEGMAADELSRASLHSYPPLESYLRGRYSGALNAWQRGYAHFSGISILPADDLFVQMLILVCDLSMSED